ncbi:MAG TPA: hypothetical protein VIM70_01605 [Clostridium sp.]|uniref:hypothetical protein n=1 Tax=Clostridium sp. TaxID=1506 RepID=UPI002F945153
MSIREANSIRVLNGGSSQGEREKNDFSAMVLSQFTDDNPSYFEIQRTRDNIVTPVGAIITDNSSSARGEKVDDGKAILLRPTEVLDIGDLFFYLGRDYIVTKSEQFNDIYYKGVMQESNNILKFYSPQSNLISIPCIIGKGNISLSIDKFISLASDEYIISCPNTADSSNIDLNTRFILSGSAYSVLGVDAISNVGLLDVRIKKDLIVVDDNLELGIANYYSHQIVYTMQLISNPIVNLLFTNETSVIILKCFANGIEEISPILSITNDNLNVSTVDNSTLTITCVGTGISNIGASYHNVVTNIIVNGNIAVVPNNALAISGSSSIKVSQQSTYSAIVTNNGISDMRNIIWGLFADDGVSSTALASVISTSGTYGETIIVKANSSSIYGYVRLKSRNDIDSCSNELRIQIKSLM